MLSLVKSLNDIITNLRCCHLIMKEPKSMKWHLYFMYQKIMQLKDMAQTFSIQVSKQKKHFNDFDSKKL